MLKIIKAIMKTNLSVVMLFLFPFFKAQSTTYTYVENNPISAGYSCEDNILIFTSSIDTHVKGSISASEQILIMPSQGYGIVILPTDHCSSCTDPDTGGTTIGTKKGGGKENESSKLQNPKQRQQHLIIEKNPVDHFVKLSLNKGMLKKIIIFDSTGKEIINKNNFNNTIEVDVSRLTKGTYRVKTITNDNQTYTKQFIKN